MMVSPIDSSLVIDDNPLFQLKEEHFGWCDKRYAISVEKLPGVRITNKQARCEQPEQLKFRNHENKAKTIGWKSISTKTWPVWSQTFFIDHLFFEAKYKPSIRSIAQFTFPYNKECDTEPTTIGNPDLHQ